MVFLPECRLVYDAIRCFPCSKVQSDLSVDHALLRHNRIDVCIRTVSLEASLRQDDFPAVSENAKILADATEVAMRDDGVACKRLQFSKL
jgi:hypothetical protein